MGFLLGHWLFVPHPRIISIKRVEICLEAFTEHRKTGNSRMLLEHLRSNQISPEEFQKVIDRILHYRISQSSLQQAMKLLDAFRAGAEIVPENVVSRSDVGKEASLTIDVEILTVFRDRPDLIRQAFDG